MEHKRNKYSKKKISDYIVSFAFLYSSFLCFDKSVDLWERKIFSYNNFIVRNTFFHSSI